MSVWECAARAIRVTYSLCTQWWWDNRIILSCVLSQWQAFWFVQPLVCQFNRQIELSVTDVAMKRVTMTTNNITNIHKENTSQGFEFRGVSNTAFQRKICPPETTSIRQLSQHAQCDPQRGLCQMKQHWTRKTTHCPKWLKDGGVMRRKSGLICSLFLFFAATFCLSWIHSVHLTGSSRL